MSFHIPLHTSAYVHEYRKRSADFTKLPKGSTGYRSIYEYSDGSFHQLPWKLQ